MPVLYIGDTGEIQETLHSRLSGVVPELYSCTFDQLAALSRPGDGKDLIVVGMEKRAEDDLVGQLLKDPSVGNHVPVVVFARSPTGTQVLQWLRLGASAVELWPCSPSRISFLLDYLTISRRYSRERESRGETNLKTIDQGEPFISDSAALRRVVEQIHRVAPMDVNVLLSGETGVGKTRLAQSLHECSPRRAAPFFAVNCGALPENLLESELFGHRRGAFTGADSARKGRFEEVGNGTLFLDEVDSIPLSSQCKLLRVIENRVFEPLGSNNSIKFRGRIVAASNAQLENLIKEGKFRADLFYRLGVVDLYVPPLRERTEDIRPIAEVTLREYSERNRLAVNSIDEDVLQLFETYHWPGNVRQLRNVIESSASLCRTNSIRMSDLSGRWVVEALQNQLASGEPEPTGETAELTASDHDTKVDIPTLAESREKLEADRISQVLRDVGNNRTQAAQRLGISRTMLYKKLAKYGLAGAM